MASASLTYHNPPTFTYDVFLSFRGEDTRNNFSDHLYHALLGAGLDRTFRDDDAIPRGEVLKPEIETAIVESRASIVVLSENYADSPWCLDELWLILEQRRKCDHFVLPVFYKVDPSDIRNQRGSFDIKKLKSKALKKAGAGAGAKHDVMLSCMPSCFSDVKAKQESKRTKDNMNRWKTALTEIANLTGEKLSGSETEFITKLVKIIKCELDLKQLSTPEHIIGMEARVEAINRWLINDHCSAIAICGMGGSGKTTLAKHIYNINRQHFESSSFIKVTGTQPHGLLGLQKQLLNDVLGGRERMISIDSDATYKIQDILKNKKMLIVVDDIENHEQLSDLLGKKSISTKSKIIITTRLLDTKEFFSSISWRCLTCKLNLLNDLESLELLSWHAFESESPLEDFKELAVQVTKYCGGNPLALQILGSSLRVGDQDPHTINRMQGLWRSRMCSLKSLKGDLDYGLQKVLQKSFDLLPFPTHKELFLHIACFFVGEHVSSVVKMDKWNGVSGIESLKNRCLLTISSDNKFVMHPLLQEMGRNVVCEESKDPAKRSRVWSDDESYHVLRKEDGSDTIEGLALDMRRVERGDILETPALKTNSVAKMEKLKLLLLKYVEFVGSYENFPNLVWLGWHGCPLQTLPLGLLTSSLVTLDMSYGQLQSFEAPTVLNSLKTLNLKGCEKLVDVCKLNQLPKLEKLILCNCSNLTQLCKSISDLKRLEILDLTGCAKLWKHVINQPAETTIIPLLSLPKSLERLDLTSCNLEFKNDVCVPFNTQSPLLLDLSCNPFTRLSHNIDFTMIRELTLYSCPNVKSLPCLPSTLVMLFIDWCTSLESVTFQSGRFSLKALGYECCFKLSEIQGLFKLVPVADIDEADLGQMQWIKAYQHQKVDLVGDDITKGRIWNIQMLYEYGIKSTYLSDTAYQSMPAYNYTSPSDFLSFRVPSRDNNMMRIQGLHVSCLYGSKDANIPFLYVKISNKTKGLTWVYNPLVYCKPRVNETVVWLSYWPIGNILDSGDEVHVRIIVEPEMMIVSGCGASLQYMDGEVFRENNIIQDEEVIGGDLSEFDVATQSYYLCRRDIFNVNTLKGLKNMFDDDVHYPDSQRWKKTHQLDQYVTLRNYVNASLKTIELRVGLTSESEIDKIEKAISSLAGVESVAAHNGMGKLTVSGHFDPIEVATCVREFDNEVEILSVTPTFD